MIDRSSFQISGSRVLAAALSECLPGLTILAVEEAFNGFYCDFFFAQPFSSEILVLLEERIRQIVRERREIRRMEMVPYSASEWLKKTGQTERAEQVLAQEGYVHLIQIGHFVDWCEPSCLRHTGDVGIVRLLDKKKIAKECYRIFGIAASTKDDLKSQICLWRQLPQVDHDSSGVEREYWQVIQGERLWLARGLNARRKIIELWRDHLSSVALEVEGNESHQKMISEMKGRVPIMHFLRSTLLGTSVRGLLDQNDALFLQVNSFGNNSNDCISFLQTVHKSLTILGFTFSIRYFGKKRTACMLKRTLQQLGWAADEEEESAEPRLDFLVKDALDCEWVVASVQDLQRKGLIRLTVWVERNLALLIEKDGEWLASDQRIAKANR